MPLEDLFIFELANNHQGSVSHGLKIIEALGEIARQQEIRAAIKFQFRHLDTFLLPEHKTLGNKYFDRFSSTRLSEEEFTQLKGAAQRAGLLTMCTPFDEASLQLALKMDFDVIKIASCSATDFPLLQEVQKTVKPVVASTAGLDFKEVKNLVQMFSGHTFALMHCVALYPTENDQLRLDRIGWLKAEFPQTLVGFSSHERPHHYSAVQMAYAQGARIFERHVGIAAEGIQLNSYSSTPEQVVLWIQAWKQARAACRKDLGHETALHEQSELRKLKRGYFVKKSVARGSLLRASDLSLALALRPESQLLAEHALGGLIADRDYQVGEAVARSTMQPILQEFFALLDQAEFDCPTSGELEISHHFGMPLFHKTGAMFLLNPQQKEKKLIVLLAGQEHPNHMHADRGEAFRVLYGDVGMQIAGDTFHLRKGDRLTVPKNQWHRFWSTTGAVIEEVADGDISGRSLYEDPRIEGMAREDRKTLIPFTLQ